jgi:hypothetical protein
MYSPWRIAMISSLSFNLIARVRGYSGDHFTSAPQGDAGAVVTTGADSGK